MKEYNLVELYGSKDSHFYLVDKDFDLDKDNDEMLDVDWENEPMLIKMFYDAQPLINYCVDNNIRIGESYWGMIY